MHTYPERYFTLDITSPHHVAEVTNVTEISGRSRPLTPLPVGADAPVPGLDLPVAVPGQDWLFMLGIAVALLLGIGVRIAAVSEQSCSS